MKRRTALTAVGSSVLAGATLTSTATASDTGPRVVDVESSTTTENTGSGNEYTVEYDGTTVIITGSTTVPVPCHEAEVVGIESTQYGDVVQVSPTRDDGLCPQVIARLSFRLELEYKDEPDDVFLEFVDG